MTASVLFLQRGIGGALARSFIHNLDRFEAWVVLVVVVVAVIAVVAAIREEKTSNIDQPEAQAPPPPVECPRCGALNEDLRDSQCGTCLLKLTREGIAMTYPASRLHGRVAGDHLVCLVPPRGIPEQTVPAGGDGPTISD